VAVQSGGRCDQRGRVGRGVRGEQNDVVQDAGSGGADGGRLAVNESVLQIVNNVADSSLNGDELVGGLRASGGGRDGGERLSRGGDEVVGLFDREVEDSQVSVVVFRVSVLEVAVVAGDEQADGEEAVPGGERVEVAVGLSEQPGVAVEELGVDLQAVDVVFVAGVVEAVLSRVLREVLRVVILERLREG